MPFYEVEDANLRRPHTVQFQLHDILEKATLTESVVSRGRGDERAERRGFYGRENTLDDSMMVDTRRHTCVKTHRMYDTNKSELWTLGDDDVSCRFLSCNKVML